MKAAVAIILTIATLLAAGCAKKEGSSAPPPEATEDPNNPGQTPGSPQIPTPNGPYTPNVPIFGGTTDFSFHNVSVYRQYTQRYINNLGELSNIKLNLNFTRYGSKYGGTASIHYNYNGLTYEGYFTGGDSANAAKYNVWFTKSGQKVFHAFFEDFMGAIIVVIHETSSLNDGYQPGDKVGGTVYFKNFVYTGAPHPPTYCWFVSIGPYDCRAWPKGYGVDTTKAVHPLPSDGYTLLGTFHTMDLKDAFNGDLAL